MRPGQDDTLHRDGDVAQLQTCTECTRPFVVPLSIVDILDADRYLVELACQNCGHSVLAPHYDDELEALDFELQASADQIREALEVISLVDELDRIDRFAKALRDGHILPEDF
jgi:hypothetical protein